MKADISEIKIQSSSLLSSRNIALVLVINNGVVLFKTDTNTNVFLIFWAITTNFGDLSLIISSFFVITHYTPTPPANICVRKMFSF